MDKEINITLDVQKPLNPQSAFRIFRGDNVKFNFTFKNGDTALDTTSAVKSQVFAKKIYADGVHKTDLPIFSGEFTTITTATFTSLQTAGDAGNYLMAVMLLDANDELITVQAVHLNVVENGYAGVYQPSPDFRDDVLDALAQAQAEAVKAAKSATAAQSAADGAYNSKLAAAESATAANNSKVAAANNASSASTYAENASMYAENASTYAENASTYAAAAEGYSSGAQAQAQLAANSAQAAQQAAAQATEISDPEGWRTDTRAMISDLAASKTNIGTFHFGSAGGALQTSNNPMFGVVDRSYCMTLELDEDWNLNTTSNPNLWLNIAADGSRASSLVYGGVWCQLTRGSDELNYLQIIYGDGTNTYVNAFGTKVNVETIFGGTNSTIPAGKYALCICIHFGEGTSADPSKVYVYVNNVLKSTIGGYTTTKKTNLNWVTDSKLGFFDIGNSRSADATSFSRYVHFDGKASRFAVFNFNLADAGAPYSVSDYFNGEYIPVSLQSSTAEKRCVLASADYCISRNTTTKLVKDITGNGNDLTVYGDVIGDKDAAVAAFVDELKTQISQQSTNS